MGKTCSRQPDADNGLDFFDILNIMRKRIAVIALATFCCAIIAAGYALVAPKTYKVSNMLIVNQLMDGDLVNQNDIKAFISFLDGLNKRGLNDKHAFLKILGFSQAEFNEIKKISIIEKKGSSAMWVDIETHDVQYGIRLMESLPKYLMSNPSISSKLKLKKDIMLKNSRDLKEIISNPQNGLKISNGSAVFISSLDLYTLREKYNFLITLIQEIDSGRVISLSWKTVGPTMPFKPVMSFCIIVGIITGILLGIILAFAVESTRNCKTDKDIE